MSIIDAFMLTGDPVVTTLLTVVCIVALYLGY